MRGKNQIQTSTELQLWEGGSIVDEWWYVYFIQEPIGGRVKIGVSLNPKKRLHDIQISSPEKLTLLGTVKLSHEFAAYRLERSLHSKFKSQLSYGEWFHPSDNLLKIAGGAS